MRFYNEDSCQSDDNYSVTSDMVVDDLDLDSIEEPKIKKKRIREKLDHLTHEEKLMRRKIKNRISAQSARDRKKNRMQTLEKKIEILCQDRQRILKENAVLKRQNEQIITENSDLKKRLNEIESKLSLMNQSSHHQLPIQTNQINSSQVNFQQDNQTNLNQHIPLQNIMNNQINSEQNRLESNFKSTSIETAELINVTQQKYQVVEMKLGQKMFSSRVNKKFQNFGMQKGVVNFDQAIDKLIHDNDEECEELLTWLEDCYQDLLTTNIEETTSTINQKTDENSISKCAQQTINDGFIKNRTESKIESRAWERHLSESNLNSNLSSTNLATTKQQNINSIKDLIVFNDHQYTKNTNNQMPISNDHLIKSAGQNLPPLSIEEILNEHRPNIQDFNQEPTEFYSLSNSMESNENLESNLFLDDHLNFSNFEQASLVSFDF